MRNITAEETVHQIQQLCARYGLPELFVTDNGRQFTSSHFSKFCQRNAIHHVTSPPYHPQSNGQAERFVDTFKRSLVKFSGEGTSEALYQFLLSYRSTPTPALQNNVTPAELFLARPIRTTLTLLHPTTPAYSNHLDSDTKMETQFNRYHGAKHKSFSTGQLVFCQDYKDSNHQWIPGKISKRLGRVVYLVEVNNKMEKRHANQLKPRQSNLENDNFFNLLQLYDDNSSNDSISASDHILSIKSSSDIQDNSLSQNVLSTSEPSIPVRRSQRQARRVLKLNIDPRSKSYLTS